VLTFKTGQTFSKENLGHKLPEAEHERIGMMESSSGECKTRDSVRIDQDRCSRCLVCPSVCPYEAINVEEKTGEVRLDMEKCQVCGVCSGACPASAIDSAYYSVDSLIGYIGKRMKEQNTDKLVITCRGSSPFQEQRTSELARFLADGFVFISLPCVGRVPSELVLKALALDMKKVVIMPCEDKYCRFKDGSKIDTRRLLLTQTLLRQLGFKPNALTVMKRSNKAHIDSNKCVGCGNCNYICPYDAIKMGTLKVPELDPMSCTGCGDCVAVCPALAIRLDGFEYETISEAIRDYGSAMSKMKMETKKPAILVLSCQWSEFSDLDVNLDGRKENVVFAGIPCAGRADSLHVLEALSQGFDGVLIAACRKGECKLEEGNDKAEKHVATLKKLLAQVGLEQRVETCFVSPRNIGELDEHVRTFTERIEEFRKKDVV
jgi:coenzyme F420-reducing hydrogenase delta subunit/ferredoxin